MARTESLSAPATSFNPQDRIPSEAGLSGSTNTHNGKESTAPHDSRIPKISLPSGGGAIRGMQEKFKVDSVTGSGSATVPISVSPGRSGFQPDLTMLYDSATGNGPLGAGWNISIPAISRKTEKGLPKYIDNEEPDTFVLTAVEDLVPVMEWDGHSWIKNQSSRAINGIQYNIRGYRPRTEGLFARVEQWTDVATGLMHWRSISNANRTSIYGLDSNSRVFDPEEPHRVFSWLICQSYDDRGNAMIYEYKAEDSINVDIHQVCEANRSDTTRSAQRYIKRIRYGNIVSRLVQPDLSQMGWHFEVVFDYGEHTKNSMLESDTWLARNDPFSTYKAGFEVRTYRLCQRILMFHHFPDEPGIGRDCLASSTDLAYRNTRNNLDDVKKGNPVLTLLASAAHTSYQRSGAAYVSAGFPPLEFEYSDAAISETVERVDSESLTNIPIGLSGNSYRFIDLYGEGVGGILYEDNQAWMYHPNLGDAQFGPPELVLTKPSPSNLKMTDVDGDGIVDLVSLDGPQKGFFQAIPNKQEWDEFRNFSWVPNIDFKNPNLTMVDLTGDGFADILITEAEAFTWYTSLQQNGFSEASRVSNPLDEERGPRLILADPEFSIFLADMSGDGLVDLIRIRNGQVCYWPNLGYGHFGAKVQIDVPECFDHDDVFDSRRVRLADIDGSGTADVIYLRADGVQIFLNQSGNSLSEPFSIQTLPSLDNVVQIDVVDFLGTGTACLVWSSTLPGDAQHRMQYINLMGSQKPHLLTRSVNNLGAETSISYTSSVNFYLQDKIVGKPWITRLPFPVQVVQRVVTTDRLSGNSFSTTYSYRHGYFDGIEREFRGFGLVEQHDTELLKVLEGATNTDVQSHIPPVLTKTWHHVGAWIDGQRISRCYEHEYYQESFGVGGSASSQTMLLDDTVLPLGIKTAVDSVIPYDLTSEERREACRAIKGSVLRQEVYALDNSERAHLPYSVSEGNFTIEMLQPQGENQWAVFFVHPRETVNFHYERFLYKINGTEKPDPRVTHDFILDVDVYGNVLLSANVSYGRRYQDPSALLSSTDQAKQEQMIIKFEETHGTNHILEDDAYRPPQASERQTFALIKHGFTSASGDTTVLVPFDALRAQIDLVNDGELDIPFEDIDGAQAVGGHAYRRPLGHERTLFRSNDLSSVLPLGRIQSLAITYDTYHLAFTPSLAKSLFVDPGKTTVAELGSILEAEARYVHVNDDNWWIPSGLEFYSPNANDSPQAEAAFAMQHFYRPCRFRTPFHTSTVSTESIVTYDVYDILVQQTQDPLGNIISAGERPVEPSKPLLRSGLDYRLLQPTIVMDENRNRQDIVCDVRGLVVGTATQGKPEETLGDTFDAFDANLTDDAISSFFKDPVKLGPTLLTSSSGRFVYDVFRYFRTRDEPQPLPSCFATLIRETHVSDLAPGQTSVIRTSLSYSDGFGRVMQTKGLAPPGPVPLRDSLGMIMMGSSGQPLLTTNAVSTRWLCTGWEIYDNKGNVVRTYEPFFTDISTFEFDVRIGVSSITHYDPLSRPVATLAPDHSWAKTTFGPWSQEHWDAGDTIALNPRNDLDVGDYFARLETSTYLPTWYDQRANGALGQQAQIAVQKTLIYQNTADLSFFDSMGRTILSLKHNKSQFSNQQTPTEEFISLRTVFDINGTKLKEFDALGRLFLKHEYNLAGQMVHQSTLDGMDRWQLDDAAGGQLYAWDSRGTRFRHAYDQLRRVLQRYVRPDGGAEIIDSQYVYGETANNPESTNSRKKITQTLNQAGLKAYDKYSFEGKLLQSTTTLAQDYKNTLDWTGSMPLETETYTTETNYDALARPTEKLAPDGSREILSYDLSGNLRAVDVVLGGIRTKTVDQIEYNSKGQRTSMRLGNGITKTQSYDPLTFRMTDLVTQRGSDTLQSLHYMLDCVGNITYIRDDALQTVFFRNKIVEPSNEYTYNSVNRLIEATGREQLGQAPSNKPMPPSLNGEVSGVQPGDGNAMARYREQYTYDVIGNIVQLQHLGDDPSMPGWTRKYTYNEPSVLGGGFGNRLTSTSVGSVIETYKYVGNDGLHGNITSMLNLQVLQWDIHDQLRSSVSQIANNGDTPETTWYVYDDSGQRIRKVTDRQTPAGEAPRRLKERIYFDGYEIFRKYDGSDTVTLERTTLAVQGNGETLARIEIRTKGTANSPAQLIRYQLDSHQESTSLEVDDTGQVISYEEYSPYGSTTYSATDSQVETPKRYRFSGKEKDEESGLYYFGARYLAVNICRWISCDPQIGDPNAYEYCGGNPIRYKDPTGALFDSSTARQVTETAKEVAPLALPWLARAAAATATLAAEAATATLIVTAAVAVVVVVVVVVAVVEINSALEEAQAQQAAQQAQQAQQAAQQAQKAQQMQPQSLRGPDPYPTSPNPPPQVGPNPVAGQPRVPQVERPRPPSANRKPEGKTDPRADPKPDTKTDPRKPKEDKDGKGVYTFRVQAQGGNQIKEKPSTHVNTPWAPLPGHPGVEFKVASGGKTEVEYSVSLQSKKEIPPSARVDAHRLLVNTVPKSIRNDPLWKEVGLAAREQIAKGSEYGNMVLQKGAARGERYYQARVDWEYHRMSGGLK